MLVVTCPKCDSRYDPGVDDELEGIDPTQMSLKVVCPACGQWLRLPENEPVGAPDAPPTVLAAMADQSRLIERGARVDALSKKPWWRFW